MNLFLALFRELVSRLLKVGLALTVVYYILEYYNENSGSMFDQKFKFDLKTAHDIKTRLEDVKGVDEIKEEV
jgi:ATP-dependent Zn protease